MTPEISSFLLRHNFVADISVPSMTDTILHDMRLGLFKQQSCGRQAGQDMIRTWMLPPDSAPRNERVIVIDAGGTNFRSCLVTFDADGKAEISDFAKTAMPGVEKELTKAEFFSQIADNIDRLKGKADRIGFCFSYPMEITKDGDGITLGFSKEVKAREVVGVPVGKALAAELEARGWGKLRRVALLNDTVAALLAGQACAPAGTEYSSYIGFILGTGMNAAYIQPDARDVDEPVERQIVVCESGKCDKIPRSDFDLALDKKTASPGQSLLEKCCSGAYLGKICYELLRGAADEGIFSAAACGKVRELSDLTLPEVDKFLYKPFAAGTVAGVCVAERDRELVYELFDCAVERVSRYAAAILAANAIQSGAGTNPARPISILCNGTTFERTHKLRARIEGHLEQFLTRERGIHFEIVTAENDITLGTAIAGAR